jgi:nicotinate-nucleotide adenylyltransferase
MTQWRIGILGGTFDPVHQGHLEVATRVRSLFSLDWVEFIPAYRPPHKLGPPAADAWHRFAMLVLATNEMDGIRVSTIELETLEAAYTIDTIARFKQRWGQEADLYFIIGADSFEDIISWKDYERLLNSCHFAVVSRPGHSLTAEHLPETVRRRIVDLRERATGAEAASEYQIYLCGEVANPISSTTIRQAVKEGRFVAGIIPAVHRHIEKYQLYSEGG